MALQYSCLENPMDGGAWWAAVHGVARSQTRLSDFTFTFHCHELEKEMVTHSSILAWRIPGMAEPRGLLSMGSHRVGHDWRDLAAAAHHAPDWKHPFCGACDRLRGPKFASVKLSRGTTRGGTPGPHSLLTSFRAANALCIWKSTLHSIHW